MRDIRSGLGAALALIAAQTCACAAGGSVEFNGAAAGACSFAAAQPGSIEIDGSLRYWSTKTPATIEVTQTGGADSNVTITTPLHWKASPASPPDSTFIVIATMANGSNASQPFDTMNKVLLPTPGVDTISVELAVSGSTPFPAGAYTAELTLTCSTSP